MSATHDTTEPLPGLHLSFAGCGFLGIYHIGVCHCIQQHTPDLSIDSIAGASAGALSAACLLSGANLHAIRQCILRSAAQAREHLFGPLSPSFNIIQHLRDGLDKVLPHDAHTLVKGKLSVSVTRISDGCNVILKEFPSRQELIEILLCSSFIPGYCGFWPPSFRGTRYIDGGFSNNMPVTDSSTVTVSPFSGEADICPKDSTGAVLSFTIANTHFSINRRNIQRLHHALLPPTSEELDAVCRRGYQDSYVFLVKHGFIAGPSVDRMMSLSGTERLGLVKAIASEGLASDTHKCDTEIDHRKNSKKGARNQQSNACQKLSAIIHSPLSSNLSATLSTVTINLPLRVALSILSNVSSFETLRAFSSQLVKSVHGVTLSRRKSIVSVKTHSIAKPYLYSDACEKHYFFTGLSSI